MTSKNPLEDGEIDSAEDIKNVRKTSSYNNQSGREVGGSDIKPSLHSVKEIFNGKRSSRKKHRRSPSSSSSSSGSDSRYCSSSSSGTRSGSTSSSTGTESSSRSSVSSHRRGRKRQHAEVANGKKKKRRDLSYSSSSSSSTSRSRKSAKKSAKPSAQLSTTAVKKEIVGEHVPNFLIRELSIEKGDMRALSNAFQFQLDRIKGLLIGKMVSGYYAKSPINYKVFDVTDQAANKLPAYIRAGKSVAQHFSMKQGIALKHPYWPCLIQDGGGGHKNYYPVELMYVQ